MKLKKRSPLLTQERLKSLLRYDPETGVFTYRDRKGRKMPGTVAGTDEGRGYIAICLDYKRYRAAHLAWLYIYGRLPESQIDHKNGNPSDNRIENLRESTQAQNLQNLRSPKTNSSSKYLGVTCHKRIKNKKWQARIQIDEKVRSLGYFRCPTAAYLLGYLPAKRRLHSFCTI